MMKTVFGSNKAKSVNVYTGEELKEHQRLSDDEVTKRIEESWKSFQSYKKTSVTERVQRLNKLASILEKNMDRLARTISMEMGKPIEEAREEIKETIKESKYLAKHADEITKKKTIECEAKKGYVRMDPLGVIYHVTPFNYPSRLLFRGTLSALLMGNTVINKNPSNCAQVGIESEEVLREAGWANGEFMNLIMSKSQSELLIKSPQVRAVYFTGSTEGGSKIAELAGKHTKKTIMELGGSDALIVLKDADLDKTVSSAIKSRLMNGGQCCTSAKRLLIDSNVYEQFKEKLMQKLSQVKMGDPLDKSTTLGPIAKKSGVEKLKDQVEKSKKYGDKLLCGGECPKDPQLSKSTFFTPTVIEVKNQESPLMKEETFGPIFALMRISSEDEAIRVANSSCYGLGASIFTKDESKAEKMAAELEVGAVYINSPTDWDVSMPEGGCKSSGYGRDGGIEGCHEFANIKTVWIGH